MRYLLTFWLFGLSASAAFAQPDSLHVLWDRSGQTDSSAYGYKILPLGDQNHDGYADWAVYAQGNGGGWHGTRASYLEFFHGGNPPSDIPYFTYRADTTLYEKLWYVEGLGDLNGDGYQDWEIEIWALTHPTSFTVPIFFGGPGPHDTPDLNFPITYQTGIYPVGDFNGDGFDDIFTYDFANNVARIYFGGNTMDTIPDWVLHQPPPGIDQTIPYAVGDFNGDGASDFICHNPNSPFNTAIFVGGANPDTVPAYFWSNAGVVGAVRSINGDAYDEWIGGGGAGIGVHYGRAALRVEPDAILNSDAGHAVASAGDINHDGYNDVIFYSPGCLDNMFGCLDIHLGHPWLYPNPAITIAGWSEPLNLIGIYTTAGVGDVNGDAVDDIAIGPYDDFAYLGWRGRCVILSGDTSLTASADRPRVQIPDELQVNVYPNPFNGEASIRLQAPPSHDPVTVTTFNLLGQQVQQAVLPAFSGEYLYRYNAADLPSGLYFLTVKSGSYQTTQKLMLLR